MSTHAFEGWTVVCDMPSLSRARTHERVSNQRSLLSLWLSTCESYRDDELQVDLLTVSVGFPCAGLDKVYGDVPNGSGG